MNKLIKIFVVIGLVLVIGGVLALKQGRINISSQEKTSAADKPFQKNLPRLVDLGADKCIPCKMMAPILEELRQEYKGKLEVTFIDVWKNQDAGRQYGIRLIPTQIFFDASGKELYRHEGFFAKEDILAKWRELGIKLGK
jgi:thioredoxin 1